MSGDTRSGSFRLIHSIIAQIPAGKVATYGQIAAMAGMPRAARTVVWAIHSPAEEDLPYHRVVAKTGRLAPEHVFGGCDIQRDMLEAEGVTFLPDGSIDMERHLWQPE
jgi:methylated-DNA-protein-cysteine methyltransferase-like protein